MSTLECSCKGRLHLDYLERSINRYGNKYIIYNSPQLVCSKCNKIYWGYKVKEMCEFVIDEYSSEEKDKGDTFYLDFNYIKSKFCIDKFISTKVGFLYDRDDYYFLPGLIRERKKGFLTPIFFNIEVLLKYMNHPKYSVDLGADTYGNIYRNNEHMIVFGINENNKIIMWLGDIVELPIEEQYYLRSENVPSDHSISSEFYEGQIEVKWAEPSRIKKLFKKRLEFNEEVMKNYKVKITQLDTETVALVKNIHKPIVKTESEFTNIIIAMNNLFVEAIATKEIKKYLKENNSNIDVKDKKGIKLYQEWLKIYINNVNINKYICPLYVLYDLRVAMAHLHSIESKEKTLKSCCKRLGLDENERDYLKIFNILTDKLIEMYELYLENLKIKGNENEI